jgi:hypothetical protein
MHFPFERKGQLDPLLHGGFSFGFIFSVGFTQKTSSGEW